MNNTTKRIGCMNDTKWDKLRLAMYSLGEKHPKWRTKDVESGYLSHWDGEWYYHFREGGYKTIEYVEIRVSDDDMRNLVRNALVKIHVPGRKTEDGFIIIGHTYSGERIEYIKSL